LRENEEIERERERKSVTNERGKERARRMREGEVGAKEEIFCRKTKDLLLILSLAMDILCCDILPLNLPLCARNGLEYHPLARQARCHCTTQHTR